MRRLFVLALLILGLSSHAFSEATDIYIRGAGKLFPIALPQLCLQQGDQSAATEIPKTMARDLDLSGYFKVLNPNSYVETPGKCGDPSSYAYSDWSVIGAEGLVRGIVSASGAGIRVQLYLHDVQRQKILLGKEYEGTADQIPRMAHKFANEIMKFFTGEYGPFGTQIAFSAKVGRFKELYLMDMDGSNVRALTDDKGLAMSSSWHPNGKTLVYTSYRNRMPDLFTIDVFSKRITQITQGPTMELGAHYSKDGTRILASRTEDRDASIALFSPQGNLLRTILPSNGSINVSPVFSPDESKIAFTSNRSGNPQIYSMNSDGSEIKRLSFVSSNYCTDPAWSPKGDKIAYVCRSEGGFHIFTSNPDGSEPLQLTASGSNEAPDWSPDGRYLVFATTFGKGPVYNLALMRSDGSNMRQLTQSRTSDTDPAWGPLNF